MSRPPTYRGLSRVDYGPEDGERPHRDDIVAGAVLRIADACERMANNHTALIAERDRFERLYVIERRQRVDADRSARALRGVVTKLRAQLARGNP